MNQFTKRVISHHLFKRLQSLHIKQQQTHLKKYQHHAMKTVTSRHLSSDIPNKQKILSVSTLLLQDGLDIQELPVIVRHSDKTMFPFTGPEACSLNSGRRQETFEDSEFKKQIHSCSSVREVYKLLEIPGDQVNVYSATNALVKICQLQQKSAGLDDLHSFIHKAVMNELCDNVSSGVSTLCNTTLLSVFMCCVRADNSLDRCASTVKQEVERRLGDGQFSVDELCSLSEFLYQCPKGNEELHRHVWIHVGNRFEEINETNIAKLYTLLPRSNRYLTKIIDKQMARFWWKMKSDDVASVLSSYVRLSHSQHTSFTKLAHWLSHNIHDMKETDLMVIVTSYNHLKYPITILFETLEKYVSAKMSKMDINLLAMIVELCRSKLYLSPIILDCAASHFTKRGSEYNCLQMFTVLRAFGQLNYLPSDSMEFLFKVESVLDQNSDSLSVEQLCEILCSFAMVGKISMNLLPRLASSHFANRVKVLPTSRQEQVQNWLQMLQGAARLDTDHLYVKQIVQTSSIGGKNKGPVYKQLESSLYRIFQDGNINFGSLVKNTVHRIDFEILLDDDGKLIPKSEIHRAQMKLAIFQLLPHEVCVNCPHLVGQAAMRERHLKKLGYKVIQIPVHISAANVKARDSYILSQLKKLL